MHQQDKNQNQPSPQPQKPADDQRKSELVIQPCSENFLDQWEHLINDVNKTDVPLECIKKIVVRLEGKRQKTINLSTLKKQGLDWDEIEIIVSRILSEFGDTVRDVDFVLDITAVAELVQPETDKLLNGLK